MNRDLEPEPSLEAQAFRKLRIDLTKAVSVTEFRSRGPELIDELRTSDSPLALTRNGSVAAVVLGVQQFQRLFDLANEYASIRSVEGLDSPGRGQEISREHLDRGRRGAERVEAPRREKIAADPGARATCEERLSQVLAVLRQCRGELEELGVIHASVFGSMARGDARPDSDVDIAVELNPQRTLGVFEFAAISNYLAERVPGSDVVEWKALKPRVLARVRQDAVNAF